MAADECEQVVIVAAKCHRQGGEFGARFELRHGSEWHLTWAFPLRPGERDREGYGGIIAEGSFFLEAVYPGCPHCGAPGVVQCGACSRLSCLDSEVERGAAFQCAWCGNRGTIDRAIERLDAQGDA